MSHNKKSKRGSQKDDLKHLEMGVLNSEVSSGDCTGLIPAAPKSDGELDAYRAMYDFEGCVKDKRE